MISDRRRYLSSPFGTHEAMLVSCACTGVFSFLDGAAWDCCSCALAGAVDPDASGCCSCPCVDEVGDGAVILNEQTSIETIWGRDKM